MYKTSFTYRKSGSTSTSSHKYGSTTITGNNKTLGISCWGRPKGVDLGTAWKMTYHIPAQYPSRLGKGGVDNSFGLSGKHRLFDDFGQRTYPFLGEPHQFGTTSADVGRWHASWLCPPRRNGLPRSGSGKSCWAQRVALPGSVGPNRCLKEKYMKNTSKMNLNMPSTLAAQLLS